MPVRVLGLISGTSADGIDAAVVDFSLASDGVLTADIVAASTTPYDGALLTKLAAALPPASTSLAAVCELDTAIGQAFAGVAARVGPVDLVCSHGQTVFHWVAGDRALGTLQLGQPAWIAQRTGAPVVADLRARDVAAGGQGAPLVPLLDGLLLSGLPGRVGALNIGGIANLTVAVDPTLAYDTGPGNALIDAACWRIGKRYDEGGQLAARGRVNAALLSDLLADPYFAARAPKSTGREYFHSGYLEAALAQVPRLDESNVIATVTALTARTVATEIARHSLDAVYVSGGGWSNSTLVGWLRDAVPEVSLLPSDVLGIGVDVKEAVAFALIGWFTWHGLPASVPSVTGASGARVLGTVVPGAGPLVLPTPLAAQPRSLRVRRG